MKTAPILRHYLAILASFSLAVAAAAQDASVTAGDFTFKAPEGWKAKAQGRPMSKGALTLAGKDGAKDLDADFYYFGEGQGGDVEANITRWKGMFKPGADGAEVKMERANYTSGKQKATLIHLKGTFLSGGPMQTTKTPMEGYAMLAAVLESAKGNVFVRLTGPEKEVAKSKDAFVKLLSSAYSEPLKETPKADAAGDEKKPAGEKK